MTSRRTLLVVVDTVTADFTAIKRGFAHRAFLAEDPRWSAEFIDRAAPYAADPRGGYVSRAKRRVRRWRGTETAVADVTVRREAEIVERARNVDAVYLLKIPSLALIRRLVELGRPRVVLDINDAIWLPHFRRAGFADLEVMLRLVHGVACENPYIANFARQYNPRVAVVPDGTQLASFDSGRAAVERDPGTVRLGWIGSPGTAPLLYSIWESLEALFERYPNVELRILGADTPHLPRFENVRYTAIPRYDQATMVREALAMDIGLFPLFRTQDGLARGTGKAVTYMSAGALAVCERFGENPRLVVDGKNGLLATGPGEWLDKLDWAVTHPVERRRVAAEGLSTIRETLSDEHCYQALVNGLETLIAH